MIITCELVDKKIVVKRSRDIGRLFNKSHFGNIISGGALHLSLIEGIFLIDEGKIRVFQNKKELGFRDLVEKAMTEVSHFEIKYLIFKDLRRRGLFVKQVEESSFFDFSLSKKINNVEKSCIVCAFSEIDTIPIENILKFAVFSDEKDLHLWFAVVDEEGDITYYDVSIPNLKGNVISGKFKKIDGLLMDNRVLIFDRNASKKLFNKEFFGKPLDEGLQISLIEALYLFKKGFLNIKLPKTKKCISIEKFEKKIKKIQPDIDLRIQVFNDLKNRGMIVKTGFKFGTHLRAYSKTPDLTHADYLIHVLNKNFVVSWPDFSRAVRLAHSVNKEIVFAIAKEVYTHYIKFGRLKP